MCRARTIMARHPIVGMTGRVRQPMARYHFYGDCLSGRCRRNSVATSEALEATTFFACCDRKRLKNARGGPRA